MTLSTLSKNTRATIKDVDLDGAVGRRLGALGFVKGTVVKMVRKAPLGDPTEFELRGYRICLRRSETDHIRVGHTATSEG